MTRVTGYSKYRLYVPPVHQIIIRMSILSPTMSVIYSWKLQDNSDHKHVLSSYASFNVLRCWVHCCYRLRPLPPVVKVNKRQNINPILRCNFISTPLNLAKSFITGKWNVLSNLSSSWKQNREGHMYLLVSQLHLIYWVLMIFEELKLNFHYSTLFTSNWSVIKSGLESSASLYLWEAWRPYHYFTINIFSVFGLFYLYLSAEHLSR